MEKLDHLKTVKVRASSGITTCFGGNYYKFNYEEEKEILDDENKEENIKKLFEHCNQIVDDQMNEVRQLYTEKKGELQ